MISKIAWTILLLAGITMILEEGFWAASLGLPGLLLPMSLVALGVGMLGLKGIWVR